MVIVIFGVLAFSLDFTKIYERWDGVSFAGKGDTEIASYIVGVAPEMKQPSHRTGPAAPRKFKEKGISKSEDYSTLGGKLSSYMPRDYQRLAIGALERALHHRLPELYEVIRFQGRIDRLEIRIFLGKPEYSSEPMECRKLILDVWFYKDKYLSGILSEGIICIDSSTNQWVFTGSVIPG